MPLAEPPRTIADVIDDIERIREELFHLQRELEKIEEHASLGTEESNSLNPDRFS
jgi:ubiquinone biosynthesis protein UbiJ